VKREAGDAELEQDANSKFTAMRVARHPDQHQPFSITIFCTLFLLTVYFLYGYIQYDSRTRNG
jgi:hypothetical protein